MRFLKRFVLALVLLAIVGGGVMWYLAGREAGPTITIDSPDKFVGRATPLKITVESPTEITAATFYIDQNGKPAPVADMKTDRSDGKLVMSGTIGREGLTNGAATLIVESARKTLYGLRTITSTSRRELTVRLDPPRVGVASIHHFINLGGAEFVVLRATPEDVEAGVQVGDTRYPFYPGSAVGISDPAVRVGFFALRHDQDINARISAYARDAAGNEATTPVEHQPFMKRFVQSKIPIDQRFLDRVVPAIASNTPDLKVDTNSPEGLLKGCL